MFDCVRRAFRPVLLAAVAWLVAATPGLAAETVRKGPTPAWVAEATIPAPREERRRQVSDGLYYLVLDRQVRAGPPDVFYRRTAYQVTDRTGLEAAGAIDIDFDPATEDLMVHHVRVVRNGQAEDRLPRLKFRLLQREEELDQGVFTGRKNAHAELDDIRVGDIVDFAYSWEVRDPQKAGHVNAGATLTWAVPVGLTRMRVLWPHGRPITVRQFDGAAAPRTSRAGAYDVYEWAVADHDPIQSEEKAPRWIDQWARVQISSFTSWAQMVAWAVPLYAPPDHLPTSWVSKVDAIAKAANDPTVRITHALRLVQDEIRYVSLSIGDGGYQPRSPEAVVRSGYGDCKDKAVLLAAILRRLGIEAAPALTDTELGPALSGEAPSTNAFDHAVVRIRLDGKTYWVDPTRSHQGGRFPNLTPVRYGWALPIAPGQAGLEELPNPNAASPTMDVVERHELPRGANKSLSFTVVTTYRDEDADWMRADLASRSLAETEKGFLKYYAGLYPGVRMSKPVQVTDDRDGNVLMVHEAYEIPPDALAGGLLKSYPIEASALSDFKTPPGGQRHFPLQIAWPVNKHHRIILVTPGRKPPAPAADDREGAAFHVRLDVKREPGVLTLDYVLRGSRELVPPARVEDYRREVQALGDLTAWNLDLTSTEGGTIGDEGQMAAIAILVVLGIAGLAALIFGLRWGLRADDIRAAQGKMYPVSIQKFVLMSVATGGLYEFFWMWKCWRWLKRYDGRDVAPFWRAFFGLVWLYALFDEANHRLGSRRLPAWLGAGALAAYVLLRVVDVAATRLPGAPPVLTLAGMLSFLCVLPAVEAVRRLNADAPEVTAANSRFDRYSFAAIAGGICWWALVLFGLFSE